MDDYVRATLLWRVQIIDNEMQHMAEDIGYLRERLLESEERLLKMAEERDALSKHLKDKE